LFQKTGHSARSMIAIFKGSGQRSTLRNIGRIISAAGTQQNVPHGHNARRSLVFTGCHEFDREP
jgi:hypothetical protein